MRNDKEKNSSFLAPVSVTYSLLSDKNSRLTIFILADDSQ